MSSSYERVVVMRALRAIILPGVREYAQAWEIANRTPEFMLGTGLQPSKRRPFGERRTRAILAELHRDGLVARRRSWEVGHVFRLTDRGKAELDGR